MPNERRPVGGHSGQPTDKWLTRSETIKLLTEKYSAEYDTKDAAFAAAVNTWTQKGKQAARKEALRYLNGDDRTIEYGEGTHGKEVASIQPRRKIKL